MIGPGSDKNMLWDFPGIKRLCFLIGVTTRIMQLFSGLWCSIYYYNSLLWQQWQLCVCLITFDVLDLDQNKLLTFRGSALPSLLLPPHDNFSTWGKYLSWPRSGDRVGAFLWKALKNRLAPVMICQLWGRARHHGGGMKGSWGEAKSRHCPSMSKDRFGGAWLK